ncbi:MAG: TIGR03862 family flavoprotein [Alphaproteobacteria bacterium]|nr:TIGR03862 family flavoprotein [Alphaproteobacteria bacterium]
MKTVAVIGGGPAGLMAAERLATAGCAVTVYERKPTPARKFLMAGRGGLNITHSEDMNSFMTRYGGAEARLSSVIDRFTPAMLRDWCAGLGEETFVGSSGRVFPKSFKASPLLRAWQKRLAERGVALLTRHDWQGWNDEGALLFKTESGEMKTAMPDATLLALGGASWPRLGADGSWQSVLAARGIGIAPLRPSNCGFVVAWTDVFRQKFAGQPVKPVILSFDGTSLQGEVMMTQRGIEGGAVYALSAALRDAIEAKGAATLTLDLRPGVEKNELSRRLSAPRRALSFANFMRKHGGLSPVSIGLVRETAPDAPEMAPAKLAAHIKSLPLALQAPFPLERAISTAGGVRLDEIDNRFMLKKLPGVFVAGEMLDWEAPTGGYLLQASFATGVAAAEGILSRLSS